MYNIEQIKAAVRLEQSIRTEAKLMYYCKRNGSQRNEAQRNGHDQYEQIKAEARVERFRSRL